MTPVLDAPPARPTKPVLPTGEAERYSAAKTYWQRFYQVTAELKSLICAEDVDTFLELGEQRLVIGECLIDLADTGYRETDDCQAIITKIRALDSEIEQKARRVIAQGRRKLSTANAYDPDRLSPVGNILNVKR